MAAMREESVAASAVESYPPARGETFHYTQPEHELIRNHVHSESKAPEVKSVTPPSVDDSDANVVSEPGTGTDSGFDGACCAPTEDAGGNGGNGGDDETEEDDDEVDDDAVGNETIHRLAPHYASEINSPDRHVRTRIYFTSESHIHSLVNVLRFCHLRRGPSRLLPMCPVDPLLRPEAHALLNEITELDYLTQIVFRMYENKAVPVESPERFRVEILFSSGANYSPFEVSPIKQDHVLPVSPRQMVHRDVEEGGIRLTELEDLLNPMAKTAKFATATQPYHHPLHRTFTSAAPVGSNTSTSVSVKSRLGYFLSPVTVPPATLGFNIFAPASRSNSVTSSPKSRKPSVVDSLARAPAAGKSANELVAGGADCTHPSSQPSSSEVKVPECSRSTDLAMCTRLSPAKDISPPRFHQDFTILLDCVFYGIGMSAEKQLSSRMRQAANRIMSMAANSTKVALPESSSLQQAPKILSLNQLPAASSIPAAQAWGASRSVSGSNATTHGVMLNLSYKQQQPVRQGASRQQFRRMGYGFSALGSMDNSSTAPRVQIEYDPCHIDEYLEIVEHIEEQLPHILVEGNLGLPDGRPGSFEIVTEDGSCVYSRLAEPSSKLVPQNVVEALAEVIPVVEEPKFATG
eukprot:gene8125-1371_t